MQCAAWPVSRGQAPLPVPPSFAELAQQRIVPKTPAAVSVVPGRDFSPASHSRRPPEFGICCA